MTYCYFLLLAIFNIRRIFNFLILTFSLVSSADAATPVYSDLTIEQFVKSSNRVYLIDLTTAEEIWFEFEKSRHSCGKRYKGTLLAAWGKTRDVINKDKEYEFLAAGLYTKFEVGQRYFLFMGLKPDRPWPRPPINIEKPGYSDVKTFCKPNDKIPLIYGRHTLELSEEISWMEEDSPLIVKIPSHILVKEGSTDFFNYEEKHSYNLPGGEKWKFDIRGNYIPIKVFLEKYLNSGFEYKTVLGNPRANFFYGVRLDSQ